VMTAATIQIGAPTASNKIHRRLEVIAGTPAALSATSRV
jgi:hypothetical protein